MPDFSPTRPLAHDLLAQLQAIAAHWPAPRVTRLHLPARPPGETPRDAEFCAIELEDGSFGLSYVRLGDTLAVLQAAHGGGAAPLAGADPLQLVAELAAGGPVARAVALAAANALTDSAWRRAGYEPPAAADSLGEVPLGPGDHLGMIGFFTPLVARVQAAGARLTVVELDADTVTRQQARFPGVRVTLDRRELAPCQVVVGTSTMLLNDTLDAMRAATPAARHFAVIGPSAGLWPDPLFARGVTLQGGTRVVDRAGLRDAMARGQPWGPYTRKFAIARDRWPGWRALIGR